MAAMLDPDIQRLLDTVFTTPFGAEAPDIAQLRATAEAVPMRLGGDFETVASVTEALAPGDAGPLPLRIYRPAAAEALPLVVYAHGGGWVTGSLDSHDRMCRILASRLRAVLVAVAYRRAPEHVYPAALDDFEAAWRWARAEAKSLGADGMRFAVAGESSGGNLAAALTLRLRSDGAAQPSLQLLLYPALDATCSRPSYREFATGYNLSALQMAWYWDAYRAGAAKNAVGLSPLAAADMSGLPSAVIAVAEYDVLRDDGLDYAAKLEAAGVAVRLIRCDGMIHGFLRWTGAVPAAHRWIDAIA
ncbi:MAG: alpha/beta hydrolase, partial [Betaproteobacteria bacterium]